MNAPTATLKPGDRSTDVKRLQHWLISQGYMTREQMATGPGIYGPKTKAAVAKYQSDNGIDTQGNSGYYGPITKNYITSQGATTKVTQTPFGPIGQTNVPTTNTSSPVSKNSNTINKNISGTVVIGGKTYNVAKTRGNYQPGTITNYGNGVYGDSFYGQGRTSNGGFLSNGGRGVFTPIQKQSQKSVYTGNSIVDYLSSTGQTLVPEKQIPFSLTDPRYVHSLDKPLVSAAVSTTATPTTTARIDTGVRQGGDGTWTDNYGNRFSSQAEAKAWQPPTAKKTPLDNTSSVDTTSSPHINMAKTREQRLKEAGLWEKYKAGRPDRFSPAKIPDIVELPKTITDETPELSSPDVENITDTYSATLNSAVDTDRLTLENAYKTQLEKLQTQIDESNKNMEDLNTLQAEGVENVGELLTPFRKKLEDAERERLHITENFEANQKLTNELSTLLTEGNALIAQQKAITGLASIRNPRIDKTISDVNARAGVIQAVMNTRNGQISQAYNMIDRTVNAITADNNDRLTYYKTLYNFYEGKKDTEGKKLVTLTNDKKTFLNAQIGMLENDLARSQANADYIKELMKDPDVALFMAKAGVTLNDAPEQVNAKMAEQSQTQQVEDFKNDKIADGYEYVPYGGGDVTFNVGGKPLSFNKPTEKADNTGVNTDGVEITSEDMRSLVGAGFSNTEAQQIQNDINTEGIDYVLAGIDNEIQKNAVRKIYNVVQKVNRAQIETSVTQKVAVDGLEDMFTNDELKEIAREQGFASFWKNKDTELEDFLTSNKVREYYIKLLIDQYKEAGMYEE